MQILRPSKAELRSVPAALTFRVEAPDEYESWQGSPLHAPLPPRVWRSSLAAQSPALSTKVWSRRSFVRGRSSLPSTESEGDHARQTRPPREAVGSTAESASICFLVLQLLRSRQLLPLLAPFVLSRSAGQHTTGPHQWLLLSGPNSVSDQQNRSSRYL